MKNKATRICAVVFALYLLLGVLFYVINKPVWYPTTTAEKTINPKAALPEFKQGELLKQRFVCEYEQLNSLSFLVGTHARDNTDQILVEILDNDGQPVIEPVILNTAGLKDNESVTIDIPKITNAKGKTFLLQLSSMNGKHKDAISFYYGNTVTVDNSVLPMNIASGDALYWFNGEGEIPVLDAQGLPCQLCLSLGGSNLSWFGEYYWFIYAGVALLLLVYLIRQVICHRKGKKTLSLSVIGSLYKYGFLIRQLVARDFKTKYKRSVLGMLWSFLNPLLTMTIQYIVFSTFFKTDIPNFIIYLLCGIICFNFFNEATNMGLMSIVSNASLINKVYVPKYIYPFSRTVSSCINLLLSLIPLFLMMFITQTPLRLATLLLPVVLVFLFFLGYGVGLILATLMVFFRDTQFLWNIFSMLLMYMTPIFYPDTIIPDYFMPIYKLNPLYHVIRFMRSILINGVCPEPKALLYCAIVCFVPFLVGIFIFRKNEDKFVMYI